MLYGSDGTTSRACENGLWSGKAGLNLDNIRSLTIPLPPLPEQCRIPAEVNKLMAICDRLEEQLATAQTESSHLLESILYHALTPNVVLLIRRLPFKL